MGDPSLPTAHLPFTAERFAVMRLRLQLRLPLYVPGDATLPKDYRLRSMLNQKREIICRWVELQLG